MVWCEALLTMLSFTEISNVWAVRLTDMSNICESLHHRNKEIAYGYLQAIAKRRAVRIVFLGCKATRTAYCRWRGGL